MRLRGLTKRNTGQVWLAGIVKRTRPQSNIKGMSPLPLTSKAIRRGQPTPQLAFNPDSGDTSINNSLIGQKRRSRHPRPLLRRLVRVTAC